MRLRFSVTDSGAGNVVEAGIDYVRILEIACDNLPVGTRYCTAAVNSTGQGARIGAIGSTSIAANDVTLYVDRAPLNKAGLFYFGTTQAQTPFGNGFRCVERRHVAPGPRDPDQRPGRGVAHGRPDGLTGRGCDPPGRDLELPVLVPRPRCRWRELQPLRRRQHHLAVSDSMTQQLDAAGARALVGSFYSAFSVGDVPGFLALLHNNIVWNEAEGFPLADRKPVPRQAGHRRGRVRARPRRMARFSAWNRPKSSWSGGRDRARPLYKATKSRSGKPLDVQIAHTWWNRDGKVARFQQMADTAAVARAR